MRLFSLLSALLLTAFSSAQAQNNLGGTVPQVSPTMQQALNQGVIPIVPGQIAQALSSDPNVTFKGLQRSPDGTMSMILYSYAGLEFGLLFQGCEQVGCALWLMTNIAVVPNAAGTNLGSINQINGNSSYGFFTVLPSENIIGYGNAYSMMPNCNLDCQGFNLGFFMGAARNAQAVIKSLSASGNMVSLETDMNVAVMATAYGAAFASADQNLPTITWEEGQAPISLTGQQAFDAFVGLGVPPEMIEFLKFPPLLD